MNLQSATKYYVRVSAGTIAGYGVYSKAKYSDITNEGKSSNESLFLHLTNK